MFNTSVPGKPMEELLEGPADLFGFELVKMRVKFDLHVSEMSLLVMRKIRN